MILAHGKLYPSGERDALLSRLEGDITRTLAERTLNPETVISAMEALGRRLASGGFDAQLAALAPEDIARYKSAAAALLSRENIEYKLKAELGEGYFLPRRTAPPHGGQRVAVRAMPLGVLLHIAAGNMDGLPALTLAEGLLTGNVNIVKLPQGESGLSLAVALALIEVEPALADYIYIFDTPSSDRPAIARMAALADGIVVWGGEAAVSAARQFAPAGAKLIEWGHRLGFAYISGYADKPRELAALAGHIAETRQLLCSSCQTIFLDTDSMEEVYAFCGEFLPCLEAAMAARAAEHGIGEVAQRTLLRYNERLEGFLGEGSAAQPGEYRGEGCSLLAREDGALELSPMLGNALVKRLPRRDIPAALRGRKGYLQTAGLICPEADRAALAELLARCGVVRITRAGDMSAAFPGEAHDGEYPLRRYTRIVNIED